MRGDRWLFNPELMLRTCHCRTTFVGRGGVVHLIGEGPTFWTASPGAGAMNPPLHEGAHRQGGTPPHCGGMGGGALFHQEATHLTGHGVSSCQPSHGPVPAVFWGGPITYEAFKETTSWVDYTRDGWIIIIIICLPQPYLFSLILR